MMGKYINQLPDGSPLGALGKARAILAAIPEARKLPEVPDSFQPNLVCVVNNGPFDAAGWCYDEREFEEFAEFDGRSRVWLIVPGVEKLAR